MKWTTEEVYFTKTFLEVCLFKRSVFSREYRFLDLLRIENDPLIRQHWQSASKIQMVVAHTLALKIQYSCYLICSCVAGRRTPALAIIYRPFIEYQGLAVCRAGNVEKYQDTFSPHLKQRIFQNCARFSMANACLLQKQVLYV